MIRFEPTSKDLAMDLKFWLQEKIAEEAGVEPDEISCEEEFNQFDLDSLALVSLSFELETLLNREISPTVFTEFNTINKLEEWVSNLK